MAYLDTMEGTLLLIGSYSDPTALNASDYTTFLESSFGNYTPTIEKLYPLSLFDSTPLPVFEAMSYIYTIVEYFCPARSALEATSKAGVPGWTYRFAHQPTCGWYMGIDSEEALEVLGATHTAEIPYVFSQLTHLPPPNGTCNFNAQEIAISEAMVSAWTSMAVHGNPNSASGIIGGPWPQFSVNSSMGLLVENTTSIGYVNYTQCDFWDKIVAAEANGTASATSTTSTAKPTQKAAGVAVKANMMMVFPAIIVGLTSLA
jgi:carboxylesterase type B